MESSVSFAPRDWHRPAYPTSQILYEYLWVFVFSKIPVPPSGYQIPLSAPVSVITVAFPVPATYSNDKQDARIVSILDPEAV